MKQEIIQKKLRNKFLKQGVKMVSPETIFFSNKTKIGKNVLIEPYVVFIGNVILKNNITIKSFSHLEDASRACRWSWPRATGRRIRTNGVAGRPASGPGVTRTR